MIDTGTVVAAIVAGVGAIVWLVRLEGRLNLTDARYIDLKVDLHDIKIDLKKLMSKDLGRRSTDAD